MATNNIEFVLSAEEKDFINGMKTAGVSVDQLKKKMEGLNSAKPSDRQFNKALKQDSVGDFLESIGAGQGTLKATMMVGQAAMVTMAFRKMSEGIEQATEKMRSGQIGWGEMIGDIGRSAPVIGDAVKGMDALRNAITGEAAALADLNAENAVRNKKLDATKGQWDAIKAGAQRARDENFVMGGGDSSGQALRTAQIARRDELARIAELSKAPGAKSGTMKDDLDAMRKAADDKWLAAQKQFIDHQTEIEKKAIAERVKAYEAGEKAKADARQKQLDEIEAKDKRVADAKKDVEGKLADINAGKIREQLDIGSQTRTGALATTAGLGTANQIASKERASNNPMLKVAQDQKALAEKQETHLRNILALLQSGTDPQSIFGL